MQKHNDYRFIFKVAPVGMIIMVNQNIQEANDTFCRMTGYGTGEIIGKNLGFLFLSQEDYASACLDGDYRMAESGSESRWRCKNGAIIDVLLNFTPVDTPGNSGGVICSVFDISNRKQAEAEKSHNELRNRSLIKIQQYKTDTIQDMLDYVLNEAIQLTESKIGYIYFYHEATQEFVLNTWSKCVMEQCSIIDKPTVYQLDKTGIWGEAVRQRKPICVNDFQSFNPLKKGYPAGHVELYRYLTVPVFDGTEIVAVVGVGNKETDYNSADIFQLTLLMQDVWKSVERKRMEISLFHEKERLRITLQSIGDAVIAADDRGRIVLLNQAAAQLTDWEEDEALGMEMSEVFKVVDELSGEQNEESYRERSQSSRTEEFAGCMVLITKGGTRRLIAEIETPIKDQYSNILGEVVVFRDITVQKQQEDEILYLSYHDGLTGLYNRRFFEEELRRLDNQRQLPLSLIIGDINGLKLINDVFGHLEGDKSIVSIAEQIKASCRSVDIIARWGGDEFIILLPKTSRREAEKIAQRIRLKCKKDTGRAVKTSISVGFSIKESPETDIIQVLNQAEEMMYKHKLLESHHLRASIISSLKRSILKKGHTTKEYLDHLKKYCRELGRALELSESKLYELELLAVFCNIGEITLPENIFTKKGRLTEAEWLEVKKHPEAGYRIAQASPELAPIAEAILSHHEHWDGSGYPRGLKGQEIPLLSRILTVVIAYNAMIYRPRSYQNPISENNAVDELIRNSACQFDPTIVKVFLEQVLGKQIELISGA